MQVFVWCDRGEVRGRLSMKLFFIHLAAVVLCFLAFLVNVVGVLCCAIIVWLIVVQCAFSAKLHHLV